MVSLVVLADLANVSVYRRLYRPNPPILRQRLRSFLHKLVDRLRSSSAQLAEFRIRLYDGWFDEQGNGTELHGMLKRIVYEDYPTRFRRARVFVELAIAPAAYPRLLLRGTCRVVPGISTRKIRFRTGLPGICPAPMHCPIVQLQIWARGACPNQPACQVRTSDIASHRTQKLVDTSIASDAVWFAANGKPVAIVSDDEDVIPALLSARALGTRVVWACRGAAPRESYAALLDEAEVEYVTC